MKTTFKASIKGEKIKLIVTGIPIQADNSNKRFTTVKLSLF